MGSCLIRLIFLCFLNISLILGGAISSSAALFGSFGIKEEMELGKKFNILVRSKMPLVEDPEVKQYVQSIVDRLQKSMPPQPFPFVANVLLHPTMNAFAVPGGSVFVHTGLIMQMEHESELANVLAHEIAHVSQRHIARQIERSQAISLASTLGALASVFFGGGSGTGAMMAGSIAAGQAAMLKYNRIDESEADEMGLQYAIKAGFSPFGMKTAFEKIRRKQWSSGSVVPEYLSTHPDVGSRINDIQARIEGMDSAIRNRCDNDSRFLRVKYLIWARYGELDSALRLFQRASASDCLAWMSKGILAERRKQVTRAKTCFDRALECSPKDALIWREAGRFAYLVGDNVAEFRLKQALTLDPKDLMAQFYYARLLSSSGKRSLAHEYYENLLHRLPEDAELHYYYGRSLGEGGQAFQGFLHLAYSAVYQNDQRKVQNWLSQAQSYAKTKKEERELKKFNKIYEERSAHWKKF